MQQNFAFFLAGFCYTIGRMKKSRSVPVRFPEAMWDDMDRVSQELHLQNRTDLVKVAVQSVIRYVKTVGAENMRLDFQRIAAELLRQIDGRTTEASDLLRVAESKADYGKAKGNYRRKP